MSEMENRFTVSTKLRNLSLALIILGLIASVIAFFVNSERAWANLLLNNYYFLQIALGAAFFYALQYVTQSGWSSQFKRVPEAIFSYVPVAALLMIPLFFGLKEIYHWAEPHAADHDALIAFKAPYLNTPFLIVRYVLFFGAWILILRKMRQISLKEDVVGGLENFEKSELWSKIFIFVLAISFSLFTFDWIMSIDVHWFSALFALKDAVASFLHGSAIIILIVLLLNRKGFFPTMNNSHLRDFSRFVFIVGIIWGYFFFAEFMLIWYGNLPEETVYFAPRMQDFWVYLFFGNIILNWFFPFLSFIAVKAAHKKTLYYVVLTSLIIGQYVDLYLQIMPGTQHNHFHFGWIEIGMFVLFVGIFIFVVSRSLSKANLIPINHPYLEESTEHNMDH